MFLSPFILLLLCSIETDLDSFTQSLHTWDVLCREHDLGKLNDYRSVIVASCVDGVLDDLSRHIFAMIPSEVLEERVVESFAFAVVERRKMPAHL